MSQTSTRLSLPYMQAAQAQKHVTHNQALERLDLMVQLTLESFAATTPPLAPTEGAVWALGLGAVNEWAGHDGELAAWSNGGWVFIAPQVGWRAALGNDLRVWTGSDWQAPDLPDLQNLPGVGINTSYDPTNRLAISADATLLTHDGNGHQLKLNKATAGDTASMLFQTGWSGRAEMGTAGTDDFEIKVSADGASWFSALTAGGSDGRVGLPNGADLADGSAANPALGFASEAGTGLWHPAANTLGLAVAGTERARITASGMEVTGQITGSAVTQYSTDQTSGSLLRTGDFGLGTAITLGVLDDLDTLTASGLYYNPSPANTTGNNYPISAAGAVTNLRRTATNWTQSFVSYANASLATNLRQFTRSYGSTGWSPWVEVIHQGRIVGTVSQSAGLPTGSVIERDSNANGDFVRYADGTQIATHSIALGSILAAGSGTYAAPYATASVNWTYPAAFSVAPQVTGSALAGSGSSVDRAVALVINSTSTTMAGDISAMRITGSSVDVSPVAQLIAVGRWF